MKRQWKTSKKGNEYLKSGEHVAVLYKNIKNGKWRCSVNGSFLQGEFSSRERAVAAVFEALEKMNA